MKTLGVLVTMNLARAGFGEVDMFDASAETGDQAQAIPGLGNHRRIDAVGDGRHQHIGFAHRSDERLAAHRRIVGIELRIEQFAQSRLDSGYQSAGDDNARLAGKARNLVNICVFGHSESALCLCAKRVKQPC